MASRVLPGLRAPVLALASLTAACGNFGGGGDGATEPVASVLGNGSRIRDIFGAIQGRDGDAVLDPGWFDPEDDDSVSCSIPDDRDVKITGVAVTAVDRFDEVTDGALGNLYVQDIPADPETGPADYQGMTVFDPSFTPPDLRVAPGDVLDFFGIHTEFPGPASGPFSNCRTLPEVSGAGTFRFEGAHVPPKVVKLADILGYLKARRYLGMLITLENVKISADPSSSDPDLPSGGRYTALIDRTGIDTTGIDAADFPQISNELYDVLNEGPPLAKGSEFKSVTGVVTYFYGFKIAPRSPADFVP